MYKYIMSILVKFVIVVGAVESVDRIHNAVYVGWIPTWPLRMSGLLP